MEGLGGSQNGLKQLEYTADLQNVWFTGLLSAPAALQG